MTTPEIRAKVQALVLKSRKTVRDLFSGEWRTAFRGRGLEFRDLRSYVNGDDIRFIDWKVTARTGQPYIRNYSEERELTVMLLCDVSASQLWGAKRELLEQLFAVLSLAAGRSGDRVGLWAHSDNLEAFVPPGKGELHWMTMLKTLGQLEPSSKRTNLSDWFSQVPARFPRPHIFLVLSDFMDTGYENSLRNLASRHDLTLLHLWDALEGKDFPRGIMQLNDAETGERHLVDGEALWGSQAGSLQARTDLLKGISRKTGCGYLPLQTQNDFFPALYRYFRLREEIHHG